MYLFLFSAWCFLLLKFTTIIALPTHKRITPIAANTLPAIAAADTGENSKKGIKKYAQKNGYTLVHNFNHFIFVTV